MKESPLIIKSKAFALDVIRACKKLREVKCEAALINQFLRFGTSIGANIREAFYAHSKPDFISKLQISLKECYETEYWLELMQRAEILSSTSEILHKCGVIRKMLISSINTAKQNMDK